MTNVFYLLVCHINIFPLISKAFNPFILNSFSSNYRATVNLNTYSLNVSLFLSVASTKFILQNKSQTSKLNSLGIKTKETNQSPVVDFVIFQLFQSGLQSQQFSTEFHDSSFKSRPRINKGELGGNGYNLFVKHQRKPLFFNLSLILPIFFNMDFTQTQVQSYRKPLPEKSKILKQSCFYAISYLFCSQHLCKYKLTAQKK